MEEDERAKSGNTRREKQTRSLVRSDIENQKYTKQNVENEQGSSETTPTDKIDYDSEETTSTISNDSMDVPAIIFKKYLGATGVRYIQMEQGSHVQENMDK